MTIDTTGDAAEELQKKLGLDDQFFRAIRNEDDWSFIVKMHALMEAAVTYLLSVRLGEPSLQDVFSYTEFGNVKSGKLAFAKALDLLDPRDRGFLRKLSKIRNDLVHDVTKVRFDLGTYVQAMNPDAFRSFVKSCDNFSSPSPPLSPFKGAKVVNDGAKVVPVEQLFRENPKLALWDAGITVLNRIYIEQQ